MPKHPGHVTRCLSGETTNEEEPQPRAPQLDSETVVWMLEKLGFTPNADKKLWTGSLPYIQKGLEFTVDISAYPGVSVLADGAQSSYSHFIHMATHWLDRYTYLASYVVFHSRHVAVRIFCPDKRYMEVSYQDRVGLTLVLDTLLHPEMGKVLVDYLQDCQREVQ